VRALLSLWSRLTNPSYVRYLTYAALFVVGWFACAGAGLAATKLGLEGIGYTLLMLAGIGAPLFVLGAVGFLVAAGIAYLFRRRAAPRRD
jgi:hypothetical protein